MSTRNSLVMVALAVISSWPAPTLATTIYDDVSVVISTAQTEDIRIQNGAELTLNPGAVVTGPPGPVEVAIRSSDGSTLIGNGGTITGGSSATDHGGSAFVQSDHAIANISGGVYTGGSTSAAEKNGGEAIVQFGNNSSLTISGGVFTGGNATDRVGADAVTSYSGGNTVVISGGVFTGGDSTGAAGGDALLVFDDNLVTIRGGLFDGGTGATGDGASVASHGSVIELFGGEFLDSILLFESTLNVYGTDLSFAGSLLEGFFPDGSPIDVVVGLFNESEVVLHDSGAVPEPATLALLSVGLAGLAARRRPRATG